MHQLCDLTFESLVNSLRSTLRSRNCNVENRFLRYLHRRDVKTVRKLHVLQCFLWTFILKLIYTISRSSVCRLLKIAVSFHILFAVVYN